MTNWAAIGYQMRFRSIERAYRESHTAFENERASWLARWERFAAQREASRIEDGEDGYGDHLSEGVFDAEQSLLYVREAFVLILYHFWEHQACTQLGMKSYVQDKIFAAARQSAEFRVDEPAIDWMRTVANCIKHGHSALYSNSPELFDSALIEAGGEEPGYRSALRLRDEDLERALAAVSASGPGIHKPPVQESEA